MASSNGLNGTASTGGTGSADARTGSADAHTGSADARKGRGGARTGRGDGEAVSILGASRHQIPTRPPYREAGRSA